MKAVHTLQTTPKLTGADSEAKRQEILEYFLEGYTLFEKLFEPFVDESVFYRQPEPTRHALIFYFGHTASFFINKLILSKAINRRINAEFESMFAIGVDEMKWDDMKSSHYPWPKVEAVRAYRDEVKDVVVSLIKSRPLKLPIDWDDPFWWVILMGCEHERIHIETSSVLHRQLPLKYLKKDSFWEIADDARASFPENRLVSVPSGVVQYGKERHAPYYGWDNEYGRAEESIEAFEAACYLTSNGEFMEFVEAGGYEKRAYWDEQSWAWLKKDGRKHPYFWVKEHTHYRYRTMLELIDMPMNWPVDVNYYEAKAFCRYKSEKEGRSFRLLSEAEWYYLIQKYHNTPIQTKGNINLKMGSSCAVDRFAFGEFFDLSGNVWQWSETPIDGFKGFRTHPVYDDFSTPTFDADHYLIKGGSWISTGNEMLTDSRYAFRRHFMQHAGFRYVVSSKELAIKKVNSYESDALVSQYCDFHYGPTHFGVKNLSVALVEKALSVHDSSKMHHALDLGCAVGRASFELAGYFERVTGIDFSARFIQVGVYLQEGSEISYKRLKEGEVYSLEHIDMAQLGYKDVAHKVHFLQGDACNLKPHLKGYDLVIASNLIDRLYEPKGFLEDIKHRVNKGGTLLIASPYTWLEEFTQKAQWLGGYYDQKGKAVSSFEGIKEALEPEFELIEPPSDLEFVIRETQRKFQHSVSQVSLWRRR